MDRPSIRESIAEIEAQVWQYRGFEKSCRDLGQHTQASEWIMRAYRLEHGIKILAAIAPHEEDVRALLVQKRRMNGDGGNGGS